MHKNHKHDCFHCGLPIVNTPPPFLEVFGKKREFCCHGCKAVCEAIIESGNEDYYRHREGAAASFSGKELPQLLDNLKIYDNEKIQHEFVTSDDQANWKEAWLILEEIRCAACLWLNERTLRQLDGVLDVQMDYTGQQVRVRWDPEKIKLSEILAAITRIGYVAHPFDPSQREALNKEQKHRSINRILFALILGMMVMQTAIGSYFYGEQNQQGEYPLWISVSRWISLGSTLLILAYPGQLFFRNAWRDLKNKSLGMDVPVAIGLTVAWFGSLYSTVTRHENVYFESIAMFVIFLLVARHIELRSRITATALLDRAAKIIPQTTQRINPLDNSLEEVPVIELDQGDRIQISPGETLPVDGKLLSANSSFDESLISGESRPVIHQQGETVLGGSINVDQLIEVEVTAGKSGSTLHEIQQLTQRSINYRPYYVDIAERVAGKFVAIILAIALFTYIYWSLNGSGDALANTIAVLIVTCPCALALAAPVALSLGAAGLSKYHVLAMRMSSIEQITHLDTLVFDKTGTLTSGIPQLREALVIGDSDADKCLQISAAIEQGSPHPFAKALIEAAKGSNLDISTVITSDVVQFSGKGVQATIEDQEKSIWRLGSRSFANADKNLDTQQQAQVEIWREQGDSALYLSNEKGLQAVFRLVDPLRQGIGDFIQQAEELGIRRTVILSGDHQQSVDAIAAQLGITEAYGELKPEEKLAWLKQQRDQDSSDNTSIMMLGDGINDAPTLAAADVSLTFAEATDLAKSNSDFILLAKDYGLLAAAFRLMRKTRRIILQNLGWAVAYNIIAVPAAVAGFVTPWMAALGMSMSSLLVVLNSLRLKK